ncbi:hypothetical protein [Streptomyces sp. NPDC052225]|uniref:hypothetical protein n=1 Tax=Streptomyces sp. NPDC052225 TaxID=3154949 RepID=UPI003429F845
MTYATGRPSWRAWTAVGLCAAAVALGLARPAEPFGPQPAYWAPLLRAEGRPVPDGCGEGAPGRSAPGPGKTPRLVISAYGYFGPGPRTREPERFTVSAAFDPGRTPLELSALRAAVDVYGPHGKGRRAHATALAVRVVTGPDAKPAEPAADGTYRFTHDGDLYLAIDVPESAACPGESRSTLNDCEPRRTNQAEDCPVVRLALSADGLPGGGAVAVSYEPSEPNGLAV